MGTHGGLFGGQKPEPPIPQHRKGCRLLGDCGFWGCLKSTRVLEGGVVALAHADFLLGCIFSKANP